MYHSMLPMKLDGLQTNVMVKTDGEFLYVTLVPVQTSGVDYDTGLTASVTYNGQTKAVSSNPYRETTVTFPYADDVKTLRLTAGTVTYNRENVGSSITFTWKGSLADPDPAVVFQCNGARETGNEVFEWSGSAEGCVCGIVLLYSRLFQYVYNEWNRGEQKLLETKWESPYTRQLNYVITEGERLYYIAYIGAYRSREDAWEDYVGLTEVITPIQTVTGMSEPFIPHTLEYGSPVLGARLKVTWNEVRDDKYRITLYELERSVDGGEFTLVYGGTSTTFTDTVGSTWTSVRYRVRCKAHVYSSWKTGEKKFPLRSNLYVGIGGVPVLASGLYVGKDGTIRRAEPMIRLG